jgi:type VI secretion system FHA domain protein
VLLTLKITAGLKPGEVGRQVFTEDGGTIGRAANNSWVLTQNKVSGRHAAISFRNGVFYIEDTSRNGVSINSPDNRLVRDRPYALKSGDLIFIEPYEIDVSIDAGAERPHYPPLGDPFDRDNPFGPGRGPQPERLSPVPPPAAGDEVDPLKFFEPVSPTAPRRPAEPVATPIDDWLGQHYVPPPAIPDPLLPQTPIRSPSVRSDVDIPANYNPLQDSGISPIVPELQRPPANEQVKRPKPPSRVVPPPPAPVFPSTPPEPDLVEAPPFVPAAPAPARPVPVGVAPDPIVPVAIPGASATPVGTLPPDPPAAPAAGSPEGPSRDLADVLAGAGLRGAPVTPELAQNLGQILRVVVSGLVEILHSRQRIKEEFRMHQTIFRPVDNNPLKFSANVDDALHNLLVKRNAAYLGPIDAFADAFDDLRDHQLAMLAGMRVAFEAMLDDFDPDRLQEEFDRQIAKLSLPLMPAKLRYWDLFREKREAIKKDPETAFARLFGEEFARAYEEQFKELRAQRRARAEQSKAPRPPKT